MDIFVSVKVKMFYIRPVTQVPILVSIEPFSDRYFKHIVNKPTLVYIVVRYFKGITSVHIKVVAMNAKTAEKDKCSRSRCMQPFLLLVVN